MPYHVVITNPLDLEGIARDAEAGVRPRHTMWDTAKRLGATIHIPGSDPIANLDRLRSKLFGRPQDLAAARRIAPQLGQDDIVFCLGEAMSFPIAALCNPRNLPNIVSFIHNPNRPRARAAMQLLKLNQRIDWFMPDTTAKAEFLRSFLKLAPNRLRLFNIPPTDTRFFTPGAVSSPKSRPLIGSGGMEGRDYHTLADAVRDLDVDARASAVSPDAKASSRNMPAELPDNLICRFHEWDELRQLYRDADIVVVSLLPNNYQAGLTTIFEAMACRKPVIMTRNPGLEHLIDEGYAIGVAPQNAPQLQSAIAELLAQPEKAEAMAQKAYELMQRQNHDIHVETLVSHLVDRYGVPAIPSEPILAAV